MKLRQQFIQGSTAWVGITQGKAEFYWYLTAYLALGLILFGGVGYLFISHQALIKQAFLDYLLPQSWHRISDQLIHFFFASQTKLVLVNMIIGGAMVSASILLFPLKEHCSALFERDIRNLLAPPEEFPLWLQALEESKLLLFYLTAQSVIFAIGYYPYEWCNWLSNGLSTLFLCYSFGLDFISPTLQRHGARYNKIVKLLAKNPLLSLVFGAAFTLPMTFLGQWVMGIATLSLAETATILFLVNIFLLALAIPAGTRIGCAILSEGLATEAFTKNMRKWQYGLLTTALACSLSFHGLIAMSMHHKSQLLKCHYNIDWSSMDLTLPSFGAFIKGEQNTSLSFLLEIHNPTVFDIAVEQSTLSIWQNKQLVSRTHVNAFSVASGATTVHKMHFDILFDAKSLFSIEEVATGWEIQLEFELLPGIPFVIQLMAANNP